MPGYDTSYDPPAPVARVMLRDLKSGTSTPDVLLLVDTGADITLLPRAAVERAGARPIGGSAYELLGFDGAKSIAQAVELDVLFLGKAFRGRYLLTEEERGILGRDVLASLAILLDGPRQEWSEHHAGPPV